MAVVWVPALLQSITGGNATVEVPGATLRQVFANLCARYPALEEKLLREDDHFQEGIAVDIDGELAILGLLERVGDHSEVHIIPAISGG